MLVVFSPIFVADTEITYVYNFVAPLKFSYQTFSTCGHKIPASFPIKLFQVGGNEICNRFLVKTFLLCGYEIS